MLEPIRQTRVSQYKNVKIDILFGNMTTGVKLSNNPLQIVQSSSPLEKQELVHKPVDQILQELSQKVMKKTWDNKEDEFWNTY